MAADVKFTYRESFIHLLSLWAFHVPGIVVHTPAGTVSCWKGERGRGQANRQGIRSKGLACWGLGHGAGGGESAHGRGVGGKYFKQRSTS